MIAGFPDNFQYVPGMAVAEGDLVMVHGRYTGWGPKPMVANLVASKGRPADQGQIIGKVVSNVIIQVVSLAIGLFGILQGVLGAAKPILIGIRQALGDTRAILMLASKVGARHH
jgi:hypothetical protein